MKHDIEKILLFVLRGGLVLTLLSPVIISTNILFPFIVPRALFFQIITEILLLIAVILVVFWPEHRPKMSAVAWAIIAFFAVEALATLTAADSIKSFIGTYERQFGFFNVLHFGILFFAALVALRSQAQWFAFLGASIAVSLYAACELLFSSDPNPQTIAGNPTFLSAYLLFHLFFAGLIFAKIKHKVARILLVGAMLIQLSTILVSHVRGAFVGFCAAIAFLCCYYVWKSTKWRLVIAGLALILIASYTLLFINKTHPLLIKNSIIQEITNFSLQDNTIRSRFSMWGMAFEGFKERPILGWGRENYTLVFNKYFNTSFEDADVSEGWEDRTHNIFFETLVNGGIVELIAYAVLLCAAVLAMRKQPMLLACLVAYVIQNLFGVDTLNSYLPFFLFLSYIAFQQQEERRIVGLERHKIRKQLKPAIAYTVVCAAALVILITMVKINIPPTTGNYRIMSSFRGLMMNDPNKSAESFKQGMEDLEIFPSLQTEALGLIGMSMAGQNLAALPANNVLVYSLKITEHMDKLVQRAPMEQRWIVILAQLNNLNAVLSSDMKWMDKGDAIWDSLVANSPQRNLFKQGQYNAKMLRAMILQRQQDATNAK